MKHQYKFIYDSLKGERQGKRRGERGREAGGWEEGEKRNGGWEEEGGRRWEEGGRLEPLSSKKSDSPVGG